MPEASDGGVGGGRAPDGGEFAAVETVLFDLDGTISDSASGILAALRRAFGEFGLDWPADERARALLGPPFWQSLGPLVGGDRLAEVVATFRRHYHGGLMFDASVFDGMREELDRLTAAGYRLAIATSKPEPSAVRIVSFLGLDGYFETVCGDTMDGERGSKAEVVAEALARLGRPVPDSVLMVGDRRHDVLGSAAHSIACVGVLWGYGSQTELAAAGARRLARRPAQLTELLAVAGGAAAR